MEEAPSTLFAVERPAAPPEPMAPSPLQPDGLPKSFALALQLSSPRQSVSARASTTSRPASPRIQPSSARAPAYLSSSLLSTKYTVWRVGGQELHVPLTAREVERQLVLSAMPPRQLKPSPRAKLAPLSGQDLAPLVLPTPPATSPPALQRRARRTGGAVPPPAAAKPLSTRPVLGDLHSNMPLNPSRMAGRSKPASPMKRQLWRERSDLSVIAPGTPAPPTPAKLRQLYRMPPPRAVHDAGTFAAVQTSDCDASTDATPGPRLGRHQARRVQTPEVFVERSPAGFEEAERARERTLRRREMLAAAAEMRLSLSRSLQQADYEDIVGRRVPRVGPVASVAQSQC